MEEFVGGFMNIKLAVNEELMNSMNVDIKELSCSLTSANDLCVRGKIIAKDGYSYMKGHLMVNGDILDKDGKVLMTIKDWSSKILGISRYDLFDLSCCAIHRFIDMKHIACIKIYPVLNMNLS